MKKFEIPEFYRSSIISKIKKQRKLEDPRKKDFLSTKLDFGPIQFFVARHFGFCYGVENAIEIAYKAIDENPGRKIYLLSEMIHNPHVNKDLREKGINFISDNYGKRLIEWEEISSEDIVIIPAFGTTLETEKLLREKGIDPVKYNTTCPFVEKVWNRAAHLGNEQHTIIIHGKAQHEETRATFSHAAETTKTVIVRNLEEAEKLSQIILHEKPKEDFYKLFAGKFSNGFNTDKDLTKIGVVNQTTMLASETETIANLMRQTMIIKYGEEKIKEHFADTRDTLCYATNDNQSSTIALTQQEVDFALVVGGYNSSNTSHLVEILEKKFPTYFISDADKIVSSKLIHHYNIHSHSETATEDFLPDRKPVRIAVTSGASCPDSIVDEVLSKLLSFYADVRSSEEVLNEVK